MNGTIYSSRVVPFLFTATGLVIPLIVLAFGLPWPFAILFGAPALVGICGLMHPKKLVERKGDMLYLYPGAILGPNGSIIAIPVSTIQSAEARKVDQFSASISGTSTKAGWSRTWMLVLELSEPVELTKWARRWLSTTKRYQGYENTRDDQIIWPLSWPQGGIEAVNAHLSQLLCDSGTK